MISIVFDGFQKDLRLSGREGWAACGPLWRRVVDLSYPFKMMQEGKVHSAIQVDGNLQDGSLQGIAVMADWSLQNCKVWVDDNVI